jgi:plasmid stabilization system protein ParE
MVEVKWTNQSIEDINNIADFIAKDSVKYARLQVNTFFDTCKILEQFPYAGRVVPESGKENIRELKVGSYRIIYLIINQGTIDILTIRHSHRILKIKNLGKGKAS